MNHRQFNLDFLRALGMPPATATIREYPEDFQVVEQLGFELSGEGEHLYLYIEKRNQNTRWVAGLLADALGVDELAVGYCGLKDRRAVTRQWFSVHLPGVNERSLDSLPELPDCQVLEIQRHHKKLRRGMHDSNRFVIRLRGITGDVGGLESRLIQIAAIGVPNYFGEQRFGREGGNLREADRLMQSRSAQHAGRRRKAVKGKGGIYLSAARSYLFNLVLAERVGEQNWHIPVGGEDMPEGPLWGRGRNPAPALVKALESRVLAPWSDWCHGLEFSGLNHERRPLVLVPGAFSWQWLPGEPSEARDLELSFLLSPGCFATSVLREVAQIQSRRAVAE